VLAGAQPRTGAHSPGIPARLVPGAGSAVPDLGANQRRAGAGGAPALPVRWRKVYGPLFGNTVATLDISGRRAEVLFEQPIGPASLDQKGRVPLTRGAPPLDGTPKQH
jgi:hypothetical protein